ncbi:uncharacterized protein V1510DRAFT_406396 [Dipodascopsis tothii]|uniref:uncharacterized protein n=1 Tax=Dipodascopsis tothii TaxID=44089 RepID=UPI0034CE0FDC
MAVDGFEPTETNFARMEGVAGVGGAVRASGAPGGASGSKGGQLPATPLIRPMLRDRTNDNGVGRHEFTPLLKSAIKNSRARAGGDASESAFETRSPGLPNESFEADLSLSMEDLTRGSLRRSAPASAAGTPLKRLGDEHALTLREQEKAIDEIKKENFALKLKIFFLTQELDKSTPEEFKTTVQENAEIKAEQMALRTEHQRLKKLLEASEAKAEKLVAEVAAGLAQTGDVADRSQLEDLLQEQQRASDELFDAKAEIDRLHREMDDYKQQLDESEGDAGEAEELRELVDQLEDDKRDLQLEVRTLTADLDDARERLQAAEAALAAGAATASAEDAEDARAELAAERAGRLEYEREANARVEELLNKLAASERTARQFQDEASDARRQLAELIDEPPPPPPAELRGLQAELEIAQRRIRELEHDKVVLAVEAEDKMDAVVSPPPDALTQIHENKKLFESTEHALTDLQRSSGQLPALQAVEAQARQARKELEDERARGKRVFESLTRQVASLTDKLEQRTRLVESLNAQLNREAATAVGTPDADDAATALRAELAAAQALVDSEAGLKEAAQKRADALAKKNVELSKDLQAASARLERGRDVARLEADLRAAEGRVRELEDAAPGAELDAARAELRRLRAHAEARDKKHRATLQSLADERERLVGKYRAAKAELQKTAATADARVKRAARDAARDVRDRRDPDRVAALERELDLAGRVHQSELKGLAMQIRYLRAKNERDGNFRQDLAFMKSFFLLQIGSFEACNEANLMILQQIGIYPARDRSKRPTFRAVATMVLAVVRARRRRDDWDVHVQAKAQLQRSYQRLRADKF